MASRSAPLDPVRVVAMLDVYGGVEFTSPPCERWQADLILMELGRAGTVRVNRARIVPDRVESRP